MKAMIFAAGLGTRLKPITDSIPKALVKVGDKPALQHVIEHIKSVGITDIVVNVHHFSEQIYQFLQDNDSFGLNISISDESELLLDTGGGLLKALSLLGEDEPVILHNADILTDAPLSIMIESHLKSSADATLLAWDRATSRKFLFSTEGYMHGWINTITNETRPASINHIDLIPLAFGGVHIVGSSLFKALKDYRAKVGEVFSITPFYIDACRNANIRCFIPTSPFNWYDVGRPESLARASEFVLSMK